MDQIITAITTELAANVTAIWGLGAALIGAVIIFALVKWAQKRTKSAIK